MTKEQKNKAWNSLPQEKQDDLRFNYQECLFGDETEEVLEEIFGKDNLNSEISKEYLEKNIDGEYTPLDKEGKGVFKMLKEISKRKREEKL